MKRLWIAVALLLAVFCGTLINNVYLRQLTGDLSQLLTRAEAVAERGDWQEARRLTEEADALWHSRDIYLHTLLRHADIDQIHVGFREVGEYITCQEAGEYSAANARLVTQIELLYEAEQLTLKNVF